MSRGERYYRQITASVLHWYVELEDGIIPGSTFDVNVLNYRLDVERALKKVQPADVAIMLSVHRDGLRYVEALSLAGVTAERPDHYVASLEVRTGRLLERMKLTDLQRYLT